MKTQSQSRHKGRPRRRFAGGPLLSALLTVGSLAAAGRAQEVPCPHADLGILVNLDAGDVPLSRLSGTDFPAGMGDAKFSLGLKPNAAVQAKGVLAREDDGGIGLEQAFGRWEQDGSAAGFGLLPVEHGIFPGRLVKDPLLQQDAEIFAPGVALSRKFGLFGVGASGVVLGRGVDSAGRVATVLPYVEARWGDEGVARASVLANARRRDLDLALVLPWNSLALDLEALAADGQDAPSRWAALAGLSWKPDSAWILAVRWDGRAGSGEAAQSQFSGGAILHLRDVCLAGAQWTQPVRGAGSLTIRLGIEAGLSVWPDLRVRAQAPAAPQGLADGR
jgi:hypothetical protein